MGAACGRELFAVLDKMGGGSNASTPPHLAGSDGVSSAPGGFSSFASATLATAQQRLLRVLARVTAPSPTPQTPPQPPPFTRSYPPPTPPPQSTPPPPPPESTAELNGSLVWHTHPPLNHPPSNHPLPNHPPLLINLFITSRRPTPNPPPS